MNNGTIIHMSFGVEGGVHVKVEVLNEFTFKRGWRKLADLERLAENEVGLGDKLAWDAQRNFECCVCRGWESIPIGRCTPAEAPPLPKTDMVSEKGI